MICIIALIVFGFLAIFSAKYRPIAKEALDCVLRRMTFRRCETRFDARLKAEIYGKLLKKNVSTARFVFRNFELLSWVFMILMLLSMVYMGIGTYNYIKYGNCNGKEHGEGFCLFDPTGKSKFSTLLNNYTGPVVFPDLGNDKKIGPEDAKVQIIEFGCYRCSYTKKAEPTVKRILQEYNDKVVYTFRDFPVSDRHPNAELHALAARCAIDQGKYWQFRDYLFEKQENMSHDAEGMKMLALEFGLNASQFNDCMDTEKYMPEIKKDAEAGIMAGVYGTPTFFINNRTIVGPQDFEKFKKVIDKALAESGS